MKKTENLKEYHRSRASRRRSEGICARCENKVCDDCKTLCHEHLLQSRKRLKELHGLPGYNKWATTKQNAIKRGILFSISRKDFIHWINTQPRQCHYCKIHEQTLVEESTVKGVHSKRMTIDRKHPLGGYTLENICLSCWRCNVTKSDIFTSEEWLEIVNHYISPRLKEYHKLK